MFKNQILNIRKNIKDINNIEKEHGIESDEEEEMW